MSIEEQIEIVKLLRADMNELNGGYQTNVVMANKKADELINHLQQVKNNDLLHSVSKCVKCGSVNIAWTFCRDCEHEHLDIR